MTGRIMLATVDVVRRVAAACLLLPACWLAGCRPPASPSDTIVPFNEAVQAEDTDRLFCLMAGAAESAELGETEEARRAAFADWARARYESYREGRDEGRVGLEGDGIVLVKAFSLGRGTFFTNGPVRSLDPGTRRVRTDLRFGYDGLDLSRLSPGTTFYVSGVPAGRIHAVTVPAVSREVTLEVLESISVEWTLVLREAIGSCPERWAIASVVPVDGSEVSTELTWVF
jgi:hypothetical protein